MSRRPENLKAGNPLKPHFAFIDGLEITGSRVRYRNMGIYHPPLVAAVLPLNLALALFLPLFKNGTCRATLEQYLQGDP